MTDEKIRQVLDLYETALADAKHGPLHHCKGMIPQMREMLDPPSKSVERRLDAQVGDRHEKVMRWLGFVQGVLWTKGLYTIAEMKDHNRADGTEP